MARKRARCRYQGMVGKKQVFRTKSYGTAARLAPLIAKRKHAYVKVFAACGGSGKERMFVCGPDGSCGTYSLQGTKKKRRRRKRRR